MKQDEQIIDKKKYILVNRGIIIMLFIAAMTVFLLNTLQINEKSILEMILEYYLNKHE